MDGIVTNKFFAENGKVKQEREASFCGVNYHSRGYYIVEPNSGRWYLHPDGKVKDGVNADSDKPAFWGTEDEAKEFFKEWRANILGT